MVYSKFPKFYILSANCPTAIIKCTNLRTKLDSFGYEIIDFLVKSMDDFAQINKADILKAQFFLIDGCSAIEFYEKQVLKLIKKIIAINPTSKILLVGCWAVQKARYIREEEVNFFHQERERILIFKEYDDVLDFLRKNHHERKKISFKAKLNENNFILIKEGCNNFCTYCIIPYLRGRSRCLSASNIIKEIRKKEMMGFKEVTLTGICISDWKDPYKQMNFPDLLRTILIKTNVNIGELELHPKDVNDDLLSILESPRISRFISIPIQHYSDRVLKMMRRGYDSKFLKNLFLKLSKKDFLVSTHVIIGFPGETKKDIEQLIKFFKKFSKWNSILLPKYSPRYPTPSFFYKSVLPEEVKNKHLSYVIRAISNEDVKISIYKWGARIEFKY